MPIVNICQLSSVSQGELSQSVDSAKCHSKSINVIVGNRPKPDPTGLRTTTRKTVKRIKKLELMTQLPSFSLYNMRSTWGKIENLTQDMKERKTQLTFLTEIWEKKKNMKHQKKIEEITNMKGLGYISCPRRGRKRGGGCGILFQKNQFSVSSSSGSASCTGGMLGYSKTNQSY